ncbi:MAG TPA: alpha/beta hydrolase [Kofleriaceae bacterium]|nr:alpha/beta hydrolase [Kofleriaceae bacterium]
MTLRYGAVAASISALRGKPAVPAVEPTHPAVRYRAHRRGIPPLADIYLPVRTSGASVVLVHGGGFVIGSRRMKPMRYLAAHLAGAGIAVCAVDYRLIFRGGRLDEALDDVHAAFAFWSRSVARIGLDARAISLVGLSAGGTLALLAAARLGSAVARVVCGFGLYDVEHLRGPAALFPRLLFRSDDRVSWSARCPRFAAQPTASTLLLHGSADALVPVDQARRLAAHRESLGLPTRLVVYEGAPHGFFNYQIPAAEQGVREILEHVRV